MSPDGRVGARVALLLFDRMDLLDFGGPYEVFLTASRLASRQGQPEPFEVATVSATDEPVTAYGGVGLTPSHRLEDVGSADVVVVPGAIDIESVAADPQVRAAVRRLSDAAAVTASVCTGAFLLADAGLLAERPFTTHWEDVSDLSRRVGTADRGAVSRWIDTGEVVTAGGLSSGIAMALHLVDRLVGRAAAVATARQLDYVWDPDDPAATVARP